MIKNSLLFFTLLLLPLTIISAESNTTSFTGYPKNPNAIKPSVFIYEIKPGDTVQDTIIVTNNSDQKQEGIFYAVDGEKPENESPNFKTRDLEQDNIGKWFEFTSSNVEKIENFVVSTFEPNETKELTFEIKTEDNPELKGEYIGAIAMEQLIRDEKNNVNTAIRKVKTIELKVTDDPKKIPPLNPNSPTWFFWTTIGIFIASMVYLIATNIKYAKRKKNS